MNELSPILSWLAGKRWGTPTEMTYTDNCSKGFKAFETRGELEIAIKEYVQVDKSSSTWVAKTYGWPMGTWCVTKVTNFSSLFSDRWWGNGRGFMDGTPRNYFNEPIGDWDVSAVTDMSGMFDSALSFNSDISGWDVSQVTNMSGMFRGALRFNSDLSRWHVAKVRDMSRMFFSASEFHSDLSSWNVARVTNMSAMFQEARSFNSDLSGWDVSQVTDISFMFYSNPNGTWWTSLPQSFNKSLCAWGASLEKKKTHAREVFVGTACPNPGEFDASIQGPLCYSCPPDYAGLRAAWIVGLSALLVVGALYVSWRRKKRLPSGEKTVASGGWRSVRVRREEEAPAMRPGENEFVALRRRGERIEIVA